MSLTDMINKLTPSERYDDDVLQLRLRHEDDTGIAMEEDELGEQLCEMGEEMFPEVVERLQDAGGEKPAE